jgi:hypothetical protein
MSGPPSSKRVLTDRGSFATAREAEDTAKRLWPDGDYFVVEAEDEADAGSRAIGESRELD